MRSVFFLLPLLAACQTLPGGRGAADLSAPPTTVVDALSSEPTPLEVGQVLRIVLQANPSTGYLWEVDGPLPPQLAREEAPSLPRPPQPVDSAHPRVGAPQEEWLYLRAVARGDAVVQLRWQRPWEKDSPPARTARYAVSVR